MRVWHDGFEVGRSFSAIEGKYDFVFPASSFSFPSGQRFGYAILGADHTSKFNHSFSTPQFDPKQEWFFGMRLAAMSANTDQRLVWALTGLSSGTILNFWCRRPVPTDLDNHYFGISSDGITLGTTAPIPNGEHHYHEFRVYIGETTGVLEWRIDGRLFLFLENINTAPEGVEEADRWQFLLPHVEIDDIYINNAEGDTNNSFEGEQVIEGLIPSADAGPNEWNQSSGLDHYVDIDDSSPDDDTTYIESLDSDQEEQFSTDGLENISDGISAVMLSARSRNTNTGSRGLKLSIVSDGEKQESDEITVDSEDWKGQTSVFPRSPNGTPWKHEEIGEASIGLEASS